MPAAWRSWSASRPASTPVARSSRARSWEDCDMKAWDEVRPPELDLIKDCVHCGFCLPTCPSYTVFEEEMDSPRGRIVLMRVGNEEGSEPSEEMRTHFDRCLGCMACVTACPSGVKYDQLIERTRPQVERVAPRPRRQRAYRKLIFALFTHPGRLRALVPLLWAQRKLGVDKLVPAARLAPPVKRRAAIMQLPEVTPAIGERRGRIALLQRAAAARGGRGRGDRAGEGDDRGVRGVRRGGCQRRRLRLGHEGLRAPARRRPGVGRAGGGVLRPRARRVRAAGRARAA